VVDFTAAATDRIAPAPELPLLIQDIVCDLEQVTDGLSFIITVLFSNSFDLRIPRLFVCGRT
jgi:hypothetical protein